MLAPRRRQKPSAAANPRLKPQGDCLHAFSAAVAAARLQDESGAQDIGRLGMVRRDVQGVWKLLAVASVHAASRMVAMPTA